MSELRTLYTELLSDLYPYDEPQGNETPREMLYNLVCIAARNFTPLDPADTKFLNRINTLIDLFLIIGIDV